jgi:hypothetical protein
MSRALALIVVAAAVSCGSHGRGAGGDEGGRGDGGPIFGGDSGVTILSDGAAAPVDCPDSAKLVYVTTHENQLYSFDPPSLTFTPIGLMTCPGVGAGAFAFSMAVDRAGSAWVLYDDGTIWKVSIKDASCQKTTFAQDQAGFHTFGMGFSTDASKGSAETLFVSDFLGKGLGYLDLTKLTLTAIGSFTSGLDGQNCELTGTGDGRLFGFFTTTPPQVAEIDKGGGIGQVQALPTVSVGTDWAFSFWGGDFYLYTESNPTGLPQDDQSSVTRYRPSDGSVVVVKPRVGFRINGAGVSTCAPTVAPPTK